MQVVRITVSAFDVERQDEPAFREEFTKRLIRAGFNLEDPIIRQPRSDVNGADFIQLQYSWFDKFDIDIQYFKMKIIDWFKRQFLNNEE